MNVVKVKKKMKQDFLVSMNSTHLILHLKYSIINLTVRHFIVISHYTILIR